MYRVKLLLPDEYILSAAEHARKATRHIYLLSMVIADHPATHELIMAIEDAARRGVTVHVAADVFTFGEVSGSFLPIRYYSRGVRDTQRMVKKLRKAGVHFHWLGKGRLTLFNGRTHSKWSVIDDTVFSFGGINLYQGGIENTDYMFRLTDPMLANRLIAEQRRIQAAERRLVNHPSVAIEHNDSTILIDGGIIGQSVIHRRALELVDEASHILFVSQYSPTGRLARRLKHHANADLYFNSPNRATGLNRLVITVSNRLSGLSSDYKRDPYLHAKYIVATLADGSKIALTGSHNFAYSGVLLGTREVALETSDPAVIAQLESFAKSQLA